jgi:hypothetical protein
MGTCLSQHEVERMPSLQEDLKKQVSKQASTKASTSAGKQNSKKVPWGIGFEIPVYFSS